MPLMFQNGKPLFVNGMLAMGPDCCCDQCLSSPSVVALDIAYNLTERHWLGSLASCATIQNFGASASYSMSFTPAGGVAQTLSTVGTLALSGGDCGLGETPYLQISYQSGGGSDSDSDGETGCNGDFLFSFHARLVRKGTLTISFLPHAQTFQPIKDGRCDDSLADDPEKGFRVDYTNGLCVYDGLVTTHLPNWTPYSYQSPYTRTITIG